MDIRRVGTLIALLFSAVFLVACEGLSEGATDGTTTDGGTTTGGGGTTTPTAPTTPTVALGSGTGTGFVAGQLALGLSSLSAGGQTSVTATLVDSNGSLYTTPVDVTFTSTCSGLGLASLATPVTSSSGTAVSTYQATGCEGTDTITASAVVNGASLTATADITIQAATVGSLSFISAEPPQIGLKNTGLVSSSTITFQVKDMNGNSVSNKQVNFLLSNTTGGTYLSDDFATSDNNGYVKTTVNAGTVPETVKVTATYADDPTITTQSDGLVISTGIADQDSFSLSAETLNPEGWNYDGTKVRINVYAADHYNNPVPDGSSVLFHTEGGQIGSSCSTVAGGCSVDWTSSNPRPSDGRVTITATMIGEESFSDLDGDGYFNNSDTFEDLPEAFRDYNENGIRDSNEEFYDYNGDFAYSPVDNSYSGVLCADATRCAPETGVHVRRNLVLVMSGSTAYVTVLDASNLPVSSIDMTTTGSFGGTVQVADINGQPLPSGSRISVSTSNGKLLSKSSYTVPSTNFDGPYSFSLLLEGDTSSTGLLTVDVTTPLNVTSSTAFTVYD